MRASSKRNSNIELLKLLAMFLIVIGHVVGSLTTKSAVYPNYLYFDTTNQGILINVLLEILGTLGRRANVVFFVCSAWFLVGKTNWKVKRAITMVFDIWTVNVIIMLVLKGIGLPISGKEVLKSLFPTLFNLNWYLSSYVIFMFIYPILNRLYLRMKRTSMTIWVAIFTLLNLFCSLKGMTMEPFRYVIVSFVYFYTIVFWFKKYIYNSFRNGTVLMLLGVGCELVYHFLIGQIKAGIITSNLLNPHVNTLYSIPYLLFAMGIFLVFYGRESNYHHKINYFASLTMLVYLIHENHLVRAYVRPLVWNCIERLWGYEYVIIWVFLYATVLYAISLGLGAVYNKSIQSLVHSVSDKIFQKLSQVPAFALKK